MKTLVLFFLIILQVHDVYSCFCKREKTVKESYKSKFIHSIVHARVLKKTKISLKSLMKESEIDSLKNGGNNSHEWELKRIERNDIYKVELELIKGFKGNSKPEIITIYTHSNSSSCGYPWFVVGKEYLIYASSEKIASYTFYKMKEKFLWTYHCLRTKAFDPLEAEELSKLSSKAKNNDPN
ncbi:hypothetical protein [Tenacibaculum xiamenense]|uniref:hypothetical protein n=1 Tax=Tenacibaculum xiamenense TaxID=1261553 RepID=UPI0038953A19